MTKAEIMIKPCPWCKKTPSIWLPIDNDWVDNKLMGKASWEWWIGCYNCKVKCRTHVTIRKSQKTTLSKCLMKLNLLASQWNENNPEKAYENVIVNLDKIKFEDI